MCRRHFKFRHNHSNVLHIDSSEQCSTWHTGNSHRNGPLYDVRTWDSIGGDITESRAPMNPGVQASVEEKAVYLDEQIDTLVGWEILGSLLVLGGHQNRMYGGARVPIIMHA